MTQSLTQHQATAVMAFLGSIGVNTHTGTWDQAYGLPNNSSGNVPKIEGELAYIGAHKIRDTLEYSWQLPEYQQLAVGGVSFDLYIGASANADNVVRQVANIASLVPAVLSVEGPNESDNWPVTSDGTTGLAGTRLLQAALYNVVHTMPTLAKVPVIEASLGNAASYSVLAGLGDADYGNTHSYFFGFDQPIFAQIPSRIMQEATVAPGLPDVTTESGYSTADSTSVYGSVDDATQANLVLDTLFDQFNAGIGITYLYQLTDEPELDDQFGLFNVDGTPKTAATALHNLTTILSNKATDTVTTPATLGYILAGMPATAASCLLQKGDGAYDLAVWNEAPIWNPTTNTEVAENAVPVTLTFGAAYASVSIYDPLQGTVAIQVLSDVSTLQIEVPDHPLIVEVSANLAAPATPVINGLTAATDTGDSHSDGLTNNPAPTVTGTGQAGSVVTLSNAVGAKLGTATVSAGGTWSIVIGTMLPQGATPTTATASNGSAISVASNTYRIAVDDQSPIVTDIMASIAPDSSIFNAGTVVLSLALSEAVLVTGAPSLSLSDNGVATYDAQHSTASTLAFDYSPNASQVSTGLVVSGLVLNGGTIVDMAGNDLQQTNLTATPGSNTSLMVNPYPATVTVGTGADTLALRVDEDAYLGNALFTVAVDGTQVGGTLMAQALRSAGAEQTFDVKGNFAPGANIVTINFINDQYAGTSATDRNLYVSGASYEGAVIPGTVLSLMSAGTLSLAFGSPVTPLDTLTLSVSESDSSGITGQFAVMLDGQLIGNVQIIPAATSAGTVDQVTLTGNWGTGPHSLKMSFLHGTGSTTSGMSNTLQVSTVSYDGVVVGGATSVIAQSQTASVAIPTTPSSDVLTLALSEDAYNGDAAFTISVDGHQLGGQLLVNVLHSTGGNETFQHNDVLMAGTHQVAVSFVNDLYAGTASTDRNLYVSGGSYNGVALNGSATTLMSNGAAHFKIAVA